MRAKQTMESLPLQEGAGGDDGVVMVTARSRTPAILTASLARPRTWRAGDCFNPCGRRASGWGRGFAPRCGVVAAEFGAGCSGLAAADLGCRRTLT